MSIIQKIKNFFNGNSKDFDRDRKNPDQLLNEHLAEERKRRQAFEKKQFEELHSHDYADKQDTPEQRLNEYLAEERKRKRLLDEKLLKEAQEKAKKEKELILNRKNSKNEINRAIRREQSSIKKKENDGLQFTVSDQDHLETVITKISECTCETTPDSEKIQCGYCLKLMCRHCWSTHQYSHGRNIQISINYRLNGNTIGKD